MSSARRQRAGGYLRLIAANIVVLAALLVGIEGLASWVLLIRPSTPRLGFAEQRHTLYDPDLGWVNGRNVRIPDMYGPGIGLTTNGQGFRSRIDFDSAVPSGKIRIICSGDSFTLGYGVDDDHTWCQWLTTLDPRLETVNMGQGGYGLDQAYLWFKRDGTRLAANVHLLCFITDDFRRMESAGSATAKPMLIVEQGGLTVKNVPVPKPARTPTWLAMALATIKESRTAETLDRLATKFRSIPDSATPAARAARVAQSRLVFTRILEDLKQFDGERSSTLVLVYLPTLEELGGKDPAQWRPFLEGESRRLGIPMINALDTFRLLSYAEARTMYIQPGQVAYSGAAGHLTAKGNQLVATLIYQALATLPPLRSPSGVAPRKVQRIPP